MMTTHTAGRRNMILRSIREFLDSEGYLEVETPILAPALIPERSIEVFATTYRAPYVEERPLYLIPSPELWMKRLLAEGWPNLYQITKAFRNGESLGKEHNPEFTILEYYTRDASYLDSLSVTESLLARLERSVAGVDVPEARRIERITMAEAFERYAGIDLAASLTVAGLRRQLTAREMRYALEDDLEGLFNRLFVHLIEPRLAEFRAVALLDYPAAIPTTARSRAGSPWAERWELYIDGIEIANCYTEETDPQMVDRYFYSESRAKEESIQPHPADEGYRALFHSGFPGCSGVALGIDRLVQVLLGLTSIEGVILFPLSSIF